MTRILHILPDSASDGPENTVASLVRTMDRRRFQLAVVSLGECFSKIEAVGVPVISLHKKPGLDWKIFPRLRQVFADFQPQIVHTHDGALRYSWPLTSLIRPVAQVHTLHESIGRETSGRLGVWLQTRALRGSVTPVATTQQAAESLGLCKPTMIEPGIAVRSFDPMSPAGPLWRTKEGFALTDFLIACVARFTAQNGHATLIDAFSRIAATGAKLLLVGEGPLEGQIRAQAKALGLAKQVVFLGSRSRGDVPAILSAADAAVCLQEDVRGMEAMAAGKPCAVTLPGLIEDNRNGILAKPGDVASLADALARLVDSPHLRARLGYAAREHALARFDQRRMVQAYEALYTQLLLRDAESPAWERGATA